MCLPASIIRVYVVVVVDDQTEILNPSFESGLREVTSINNIDSLIKLVIFPTICFMII